MIDLACIPARILDRLVPVPDTGCWLWTGALNEKGYAVVWFAGKRRKLHRVLFKLVRGRWPRKDRVLLHKCDTRACCLVTADASTHLREGTYAQNAKDMHAKGRTGGCCAKA